MENKSDLLVITYRLLFEDGAQEEFEVRIDKRTLLVVQKPETIAPEWAKLENKKCSNCPLNERENPYCPLALSLVDLVARIGNVLSYEKVRAEVMIDGKSIIKDTTAQKAASSLMGLITAVSGCPHSAWFRPMARFHVPFATLEETTYRACGMYMLAQYFLSQRGQDVDVSLDGLAGIYGEIAVVNSAMAERLRQACSEDASVNALILLDLFTKTVPLSLANSLKVLEPLFAAYFQDAPKR